MIFEFGGNTIVEVITADGRAGFDRHGQLWVWTAKDADGFSSGTIVRNVRGCTCYICGQGWELTADRLKDQFMIDGRLVHQTCGYGHQKMVAYNDIRAALMDAGYLFQMEEVPPRYPHSTPWQRITVLSNQNGRGDTGFRIVLGRRKHVWEIRAHNQNESKAHFSRLQELFTDVTHTKGYCVEPSEEEPEFGPYFYVHAWTKEQLVDYLQRIRSMMPDTDRTALRVLGL